MNRSMISPARVPAPAAGRPGTPSGDRVFLGRACLRPFALLFPPLLALLASAVPAAPRRSAPTENLVPANMQALQDDKGNQWSVNNYGFLQNTGNSFFNNILMLHINGQQFYNHQPLMTADGKEFVLPGQQPMAGLQITRRVRLLEKDGAMRYVDLLHNPGSAPVTATVEYRNNFSNPLKSVVTDRGVASPTALNRNETGLFITSKQQGQKSVLFTLCAPTAKSKPTFGKRSQYEFNFTYGVTVPPGQTSGLCYSVALVQAPDENDRAAVDRLFRNFAGNRILKSVRREDLPLLANFATRGAGGPAAFLALSPLESLDVERAKSDVLAMGDKTRLFGTASCGELNVATEFGSAVIPFERVAALVGGARTPGTTTRIFLRDGQVFSGDVTAADFRFVMPSGARVDCDPATIDRLVRSATPDEGKWESEAAALIATYQGDQIALAPSERAGFQCTTPWGPVKFSLADVAWIGPAEETGIGHRIELKDGSRFFGFLSGEAVPLRTRLFGERPFVPAQIRALVSAAAMTKATDDPADPGVPAQPHIVLAGGQRLLGQFDAAVLTILTTARAVEVPPHSIRTLRNVREESEAAASDESPPFEIEIWGGGTIVGQCKDPVIPVRVRDVIWRVPVDDIVEFQSQSPRLTDETRVRIAELVRDLGSDDWEKRESATGALGEFGFMARPVLDEALKSSPDPEVRRRVEKLIEEME